MSEVSKLPDWEKIRHLYLSWHVQRKYPSPTGSVHETLEYSNQPYRFYCIWIKVTVKVLLDLLIRAQVNGEQHVNISSDPRKRTERKNTTYR